MAELLSAAYKTKCTRLELTYEALGRHAKLGPTPPTKVEHNDFRTGKVTWVVHTCTVGGRNPSVLFVDARRAPRRRKTTKALSRPQPIVVPPFKFNAARCRGSYSFEYPKRSYESFVAEVRKTVSGLSEKERPEVCGMRLRLSGALSSVIVDEYAPGIVFVSAGSTVRTKLDSEPSTSRFKEVVRIVDTMVRRKP